MSENKVERPNTPREKTTAQGCTCELVANDVGNWEIRPDSSPECVETVEALAHSMGPNGRQYLAKHISRNSEVIEKAVDKLSGSDKSKT